VASGTGESGWSSIAFDAVGDRVAVYSASGSNTLLYDTPDGHGWTFTGWSRDGRTPPVVFSSAAFDPAGNVVAAGYTVDAGVLCGTAVGHHPNAGFLLELDAGGRCRWARDLGEAQVAYARVATSAIGTVVMSGNFQGTITWGATRISSLAATEGVLLTAEADGTPRWVQGIDPAGGTGWQLAVDPSGRAALAGLGWSCPALIVQEYDLAGAFHWQRAIGRCGQATPSQLGFDGHDVVIGGRFDGGLDLGEQHLDANLGHGFVVDLSP
jgi:hypothetical protein